jgi:hypothetical protein
MVDSDDDDDDLASKAGLGSGLVEAQSRKQRMSYEKDTTKHLRRPEAYF